MQDYLATRADQLRTGFVKRFAPRLWTVDFARPMMAAVTAAGPKALRVDLDFLTASDLGGLIWASEDRWSHPLLAYVTERDYRGLTLEFEWVAGPGMMPLDAANGATLTIEGRDSVGLARTWYVRLWNYASGTPMAARVALDFDAIAAGFQVNGEAVFTGDIDRMFLSMSPAAYDVGGAPLPGGVSTFVELREIACRGSRSTIAIGDAFLPEHGLRMASGYDDSYNQAPERLVEQWFALGYRGLVNHYVGMSHYYSLVAAAGDRFEVADGLCAAAVAWHRALLRELGTIGAEIIISLSYELFDANAPAQWAQRDLAGNRALTGWMPPSTLLSPMNEAAMAWLGGIAGAFVALVQDAGLPVHFQVGEPWWWVGPNHAPCFYDADTAAQWLLERGQPAPEIADIRGAKSVTETEFLDWLGERLAQSTADLRELARIGTAGAFRSYLLFYAPQVLDSEKPDLWRANMPAGWAYPEWDVLQLEDYSFVVAEDEFGMRRGREAVADRLRYPVTRQHYLAGFVLDPATAASDWPAIAEAARSAMQRGVAETIVWAWPQISRDGFVAFSVGAMPDEGDSDVLAFHDVRFPLDLGLEAVGGPEFLTQIALMASGFEQRNVHWAAARLRYDAGIGVRSETDLVALLDFFRARRGQAFAFRFRDPIDCKSCMPSVEPSATDQLLGTGDGRRLSFPLVKRYGFAGIEEVRGITRPVDGSVLIAVGGESLLDGWTLEAGGSVRFAAAPGVGVEVRAGYAFDVPVRFATDRIDISLSGWRAGEVPTVPIVEVRE